MSNYNGVALTFGFKWALENKIKKSLGRAETLIHIEPECNARI